MEKIKEIWESWDSRKRIIAALSVIAIVASVIGITRVATEPTMALLYSGLDAKAAGEVVAALEAENVPFEIRDSSIFVQENQRDRLRMELAGKGLPAGGSQGYEILDGLSGFGTTSQMFDAAYWRAKEGELARTITGSPDVRAARVHLAIPEAKPFSRQVDSTASVTVTMARGSLDATEAKAIRYLVSSAVSGMKPESVAVLDSTSGVVLAGADDGPGNGLVNKPNDQAELLRKNIQRMLEARVGPGRAIVEVNVDAQLDSQTVTERVIDPQSRVPISTETEQQQDSSSGTNPSVTVASNLPSGQASNSGQNSSSSSKTSERQNFDVSETKTERVTLPGQVKRISVAVMVDGLTTTGADGKTTWAPRPQAELDTLKSLVQSAVGFNADRGDTVTLETLQFTLPPDQGSLAERTDPSFLNQYGARLAQIGVLGVIVLALLLFVVRPMVLPKPEVELVELTGPRDLDLEQLRQMSDEVLDLPAQSQTKIERLREAITNRGEESAAILRSWIETPDSHKEAMRS